MLFSQLKTLEQVQAYESGQQLKPEEMFEVGQHVDVAGKTIGKGFQGMWYLCYPYHLNAYYLSNYTFPAVTQVPHFIGQIGDELYIDGRTLNAAGIVKNIIKHEHSNMPYLTLTRIL